MNSADHYRALAAKFLAEAANQTDPVRRGDLEWLALSYRRLADQAEGNKQAGIVYEPRMAEQHKPTPQPQESQQQQSKLD